MFQGHLIIPEKPPAKNLIGSIFIFLFEYPFNCKITKKNNNSTNMKMNNIWR